jgi:beta-lactamase class A
VLLVAVASASPATETLRGDLERAVAGAGGVAGVSVLHVEGGERASIRGGEPFPMASVVKLPIALQILHRVDQGALKLEQTVPLAPSDYRSGAGRLGAAAERGASVPLRELLEKMLVESDNTACDALLRLAGGPAAVTARLRELGISGIRADRSEGEIGLAEAGIDPIPPAAEWSHATLDRLHASVSPAHRRAAILARAKDPRDTATPDGMADLLALVQRGRALSRESTELLLRWMTAATTGKRRLRAGVPAGTAVADKTGTGSEAGGLNVCTNDVGLITLPDGKHLALAVFIRQSTRPAAARERAIAEVARAAWQRYAGTPRPGSL